VGIRRDTERRHQLALEGDGTDGLVRTYKAVDTCAAEFDAATPYYYSAHEQPNHDGTR
jgi:hypothetical protein